MATSKSYISRFNVMLFVSEGEKSANDVKVVWNQPVHVICSQALLKIKKGRSLLLFY